MCEPVTLTAIGSAIAGSAGTIGTVATVAGGALGAYGAYQQGQQAKEVGRYNQQMAELAAQDAIRRGDEDAMKVRQKASQLKGAQRSLMAAKGLDLGVGTAQELQDQTDFFGATDVATTRTNARREAWSARSGGQMARYQGDAAARQGNLAAVGSLLSTGGQVASKWYTAKG